MNVNSVCFCVLVSLLFECGQSNSPCPDIFNFYTEDGKNVFGQITLQPVETVSSLKIRINYTVQADLNDDVGRIVEPDNVLRKYNMGEIVRYRVYFPVTSPRPKVTEIAVNDVKICTGPGDEPTPSQGISLPSLSITNSYVGGGSPAYKRFRHQPQTTPQAQPEVKAHSMGQELPVNVKKFSGSFDTINKASVPFMRATARSPPATTTSAPATTTTTTTSSVYSKPVRKTTRPEYHYSEECGVVAGSNDISRLIYNGKSYERGEVPWLVAIYRKVKKTLEFICGGTLVSDRHVITAAHCMRGSRIWLTERDIVVKVGVHDLNGWSDDIVVISEVMTANINEFFNSSSLKNDLMILTLNKRIWFNNFISPACLWSGNPELALVVGATGVVAGWGDDEHDEPQMLRVPIVSTKECRASTPELHKLTTHNTLCAGSRDGSGPCNGDSGGGLYLLDRGKWRLRGVVSLSLSNGNSALVCNLNEYVVYTDTAQYLPWIRSVLSQKYFD